MKQMEQDAQIELIANKPAEESLWWVSNIGRVGSGRIYRGGHGDKTKTEFFGTH